MKSLFILTTLILIMSFWNVFAQSEEDWQCGVGLDTTYYQPIESITPIIDDTLKVGLLLVQFADWQDSLDSRGGVGWSHKFELDSVDTNKYKYDDYWNIFFSRGTYYDDNPNQPTLHPDGPTHDIVVYGSFTDYWWEVSHRNLYTQAAETHPANSGMFRTGLINRVNPDSTVQWITLNFNKDHYYTSSTSISVICGKLREIITDAKIKASQMYQNSELDVDISNTSVFDKIIIVYAGLSLHGVSTVDALNGRYTISHELISTNYETPKRIGFGVDAHEFGHLIGFDDLHGIGVGAFSLMASSGSWNHRNYSYMPSHVDAWHKLQTGWLDYQIIENDTTNITLFPVSDSSLTDLPKVGVLVNKGNPGGYFWKDPTLDYFILENRATLGFDRNLKFNNQSFNGGMILMHYGNSNKPFVLEADGDYAIGVSNNGAPSDFFPGTMDITAIDDTTWPNLNMQNNAYSHFGIYGIQFDNNSYQVNIDTIKTKNMIQTINSNTTWSGTYELKNDILITNGAALTIEAGTQVLIDSLKWGSKVNLFVEKDASIVTLGSENSPVIFRCQFLDSTSVGWEGITFSDSSSGEFSYTKFRNASNTISCNFDGDGKLVADNCIFISGILTIDNADTNSLIENSIFTDSCYININNSEVNIINNRFINNDLVKIDADNSIFKNNIFLPYDSNVLGIAFIGSNCSTKMLNNTIAYCKFGIVYGNNYSLTLRNNIFFQNQNTLVPKGNVTYNNFFNVINNNAPSGNGNTSVDPVFLDPENGDFTLDFNSPCIDAGDPNDGFANEPLPNGGRINMGHQGNTSLATESFDIIAEGNVISNTTWQDTVLVKDDLFIHMAADLTINDGTYIVTLPDKLITVRGKILSNAEENDITFTNYRDSDKWQGIYIDHSEEISQFNNSKIFNAINGLYVEKTEVEVSNTLFKNNNTGFLGDNATGAIEECSFENNFIQGAYFSQSQMDVFNSSFESNGGRGIYVQYGSGMTFIEDTVKYNGGMDPDIELKGGMILYSSSPLIRESEIVKNEYNGILTLSVSDPVMNLEEKGYNLIAQNGEVSEEADYAEIQCMDVSASKLDYGHNDIIDNRGDWLLYSHSVIEMEIPIQGNYWGTDDEEEIDARIFGFFDFTPFDENANTIGGAHYSEGEKIFQRGLTSETRGNITSAISAFDSVLQYYPTEIVAVNALDRKFNCYKLACLDFNNLRSEYINLSVNHKNEDVRKRAKNLSIACLIELENYSQAISEYDTLIYNSQNNIDSLYAETDKALAELKQSGTLLAKATGTSVTPKYFKQVIEKSEIYRDKSENLLAQRFISAKKIRNTIPEKFALYQNYPNPFNPTTTIKFDLPKSSDVKIVIYNLLGQEIKTLLNERKDSGRFEIQWDSRNESGKSVASGVYLFRLITNDYVKTNKMILLR